MKLREIMTHRNIRSAAKLAELLGWDVYKVRRILREKQELRESEILEISEKLGAHPVDIIGVPRGE